MRSEAAAFPAMGIDTVAKLTALSCKALRAEGVRFAVRYLGGLTPAEVTDILASGLALMACTYSRKEGWVPSGSMGTSDGKAAVIRARYLQLPANTTIWLDLEGCAGPAAATAAWVDAWATEVRAAGFIAGLYVGASPGGLDSDELYRRKVTRYWHSLSQVPNVSKCGYCMYQLYPPNVKLGGVQVDIDFVQSDYLGRLPTWVVG